MLKPVKHCGERGRGPGSSEPGEDAAARADWVSHF